MKDFDHILLIGFGGPTNPGEIRPFLEEVVGGRNVPEERLKEVAYHYEAIGGSSPYHENVFRLRESLGNRLREAGVYKPLFVGMRNWHPFLAETLREIKKQSLKRGLGIILAPHRSEASCKRYKRSVEAARVEAGALDIEYEYLEPWFDHPLFIEAQANSIKRILDSIPEEGKGFVHILFTAHSIPVVMNEACEFCRYEEEFRTSSTLVARRLGLEHYSLAYQSRSGRPQEPWLGPDVIEALRNLPQEKVEKILVVPIGFLCDHAEVLYDLDIEVRKAAEARGFQYFRAKTVMSDAKFIQMLAESIACSLSPKPSFI